MQYFHCGSDPVSSVRSRSSAGSHVHLSESRLCLTFQIKALISAPPTESTPGEIKKNTEEPIVMTTPAPDPPPPAAKAKPKADPIKAAKTLGLLGKRTFDK